MTFLKTSLKAGLQTGLLAAILAAGLFTTAAPAAAHDRRGGNDAAIAVGAGLVGLAVGAAIASDRDDRGYYDAGYYNRGYYPAYPAYRAYPAYPAYPAYRAYGYPAYPAYPVYRAYPAWRGHGWRDDRGRRWQRQDRRAYRRGW